MIKHVATYHMPNKENLFQIHGRLERDAFGPRAHAGDSHIKLSNFCIFDSAARQTF
jgi:hypothetical protein